MSAITKVYARQVLNSQGNPTIEVEVWTKSKNKAIAKVPSGSSVGKNEAKELLDNDPNFWMGKSVFKAIENINKIIAPKIIGINSTAQKKIDKLLNDLDGTEDKSNLGANAILAVSMAVAKAGAKDLKIPLYEYFAKLSKTTDIWLPIPMFNILNGGKHSDNNVDFQEFMIFPIKCKDYYSALECGHNIFKNLEIILKEKGLNYSKGLEGGYAPNLKSNEEAIQLIIEAIKKSGHVYGVDILIAIDVAATSFYNPKKKQYTLKCDNKVLTSDELISYYVSLVKKYNIYSFEDPMAENDISSFVKLHKVLGKKVQIVGDDLFVTNKKIFRKYVLQNVANAIIIKMNQIGTITETIDTILVAKKYDYNCIISHRSAETEDNTIADLAVGVNSGQIKTGSLWGSERLSKYNRLIVIGEEISKK